MTDSQESCPCGSTEVFEACCQPLLAGVRKAETAEALMRSRYCAYLKRDSAYLLATWHPSTTPGCLDLASSAQLDWEALEILGTQGGGRQDTEGRVEFVAHYQVDGIRGQLRENSRFQRIGDRWFYVDGDIDR